MAVIKYQINGKADTKPIKNTEAAAEGMFKKISAIDNKLKAFVGVKVFQEVGKAVKGALDEYDNFQKSVNGEINFTKPFDDIKTSMAGTLGTVRDELLNIVGDIFGENGFKALEDIIPKVGASLIGALKVASTIVVNIKDNFSKFLNPEIWTDFFNKAKDLGSSFANFLGNALRDSFTFAANFLKWAILDINLQDTLYEQISPVFQKIGDEFEKLGLKKLDYAAMRNQYRSDFAQVQSDKEQKKKESMNNVPTFSLSDETKNAFNNVSKNLGNAVKALLDTVAGKDVSVVYEEAYKEAMAKLEFTIAAMNAAKDDPGKDKPDKSPNSNKSDKDKPEKIEILTLGETLGKDLGEKMKASMGKAGELLGQSLGNIADLFGDVSTAINAIFTGNPLGLIITLITKLFSVFSNISGPFAAFMNIFDVFFDVVEEICAVLEPALSVIFKPILDVVQMAARVFGMFMNIIIPIVSIFSLLLVPVLKLLQPILYGIGWVFAALADGIGSVYNFISDVVRKITFGLVNMKSMPTNNREKLEQGGAFAEGNYDQYQNSNNSTSYSVAGDIYIYINFSHSYVNGDSEEIAIMLRNEIRKAERKGY